MIQRCVMIRSGSPERVDRVLMAFTRLRGVVPGLERIVTATDRSGRARGYTHMFTLTFQDDDAIKAWNDHPAHAPIREELNRCAELIVFEYEETAPGPSR